MKILLYVFGFLMVTMASASSSEEEDDTVPVYYYKSPFLPLFYHGAYVHQAHYVSVLPYYPRVGTHGQGSPGSLRLYNPAEDIGVNPEIVPYYPYGYYPYFLEKKKEKKSGN
ncbi:uncharacterized protein LOC122268060 [Penaeus japonicus]|uniref:uncharacterized protein LOC122268060 n=1 Tax=Penaeus japonicus TaxID=27405 RepID=UPI001C71696D|nr:uncharacterized protein LOC122268060 [Penaeus japonicus]